MDDAADRTLARGELILLRMKNAQEDKMAETQIEWTDATWNPVAGCTIVTAGCTNCHAMEMARRLEAMGIAKYRGLTGRSGKRAVWRGVVREDRETLLIPYQCRKPRMIFVNSMSDLIHERVSDEFILDVWKVMHEMVMRFYMDVAYKRWKRDARLKRIAAPMAGGTVTSFIITLLIYPAICVSWRSSADMR